MFATTVDSFSTIEDNGLNIEIGSICAKSNPEIDAEIFGLEPRRSAFLIAFNKFEFRLISGVRSGELTDFSEFVVFSRVDCRRSLEGRFEGVFFTAAFIILASVAAELCRRDETGICKVELVELLEPGLLGDEGGDFV
jgi:hypothetical protein